MARVPLPGAEVVDLLMPHGLQEQRGLLAATAAAADHEQDLVLGQFLEAAGQLVEREQHRSLAVAFLPFAGRAHIHHERALIHEGGSFFDRQESRHL